jgi:hypothetical protein
VSGRLRAAALIAMVAGLLAASEVVWVLAYLERASDAPAFAMALVVTVAVPTLLAAIAASLIAAVPRWTRVAAIAAVAASGLAAAGVEAGIFIADDPADPALIHWVAALPLFTLIVAVLLVGRAAWSLLRPLPQVWRVALTAFAAIVSPVVLAVIIMTGTPLVVLVALASPVALVPLAIAVARRQGRPSPI